MKNIWSRVKPVLIICFWLLCSGSVMVLFGASMSKQHHDPFRDIIVNINDDNGMMFINKEEILQMLKDHQVNIEKAKPVNAFDYHNLETLVESNPFVKSAQVYVDANEMISVNVIQHLPVLRIINNQSVSYYLDEEGKRMPLSSNFTARVPVATGYIFTNAEHQTASDSVLEQNLFKLANFIHRDSFLTALTEQIVVDPQQEFELIPALGNNSILIGDSHDLAQKFNKLETFYREGLGHSSLGQYSKINLKYENEIYCTKAGAVNMISGK